MVDLEPTWMGESVSSRMSGEEMAEWEDNVERAGEASRGAREDGRDMFPLNTVLYSP